MPCLSQLFHLPFSPPFAGCLRVAFLAGAFFDRFCACFVAPFLAGADLASLDPPLLDVRVLFLAGGFFEGRRAVLARFFAVDIVVFLRFVLVFAVCFLLDFVPWPAESFARRASLRFCTATGGTLRAFAVTTHRLCSCTRSHAFERSEYTGFPK